MNLFETPRLVARRITLEDVPAMLAVYGDREAMRYVGDGEPLDEAGCRGWVEVTDRNFERRGYGMVAFVERATGQAVGFGGVVHPGDQPEVEVKYAFRRDRWGEGFATEAVVELMRHAERVWDVRRVIATVDPANRASQGVLAKVGFVHAEDRRNEDGTVTGVWEWAAR